MPILFTYRAAIKERYHTRHLYAMLMPVADGNLADFLEHWGNTPLCPEKASSMDTLICWPKQLADGLNYLHNHPSGTLVRHNDIKPSNLLLQGSTILYADFGLSRMFDTGEATTTYTPAVSFTKLYSAPEVVDGPRRRSSDIFSLGCVFSEILTVFLGKSVAEAAKFRGPERAREYAQQPNQTLHWLLRLLFWQYKFEMLDYFDVKMCILACFRMLEPQPDLRVTAKQLCLMQGWESNLQDAPEPINPILSQLRLRRIPAPGNLEIISTVLNRVMIPGFEVSWDDLHHSDNFLEEIWHYIFPLGPDCFQIPVLYS
ncbi:MAG: hypothetical protein M1824_002490 [Vezdaea acicularis]|nr:MAG: hypothetical protein M1824_002490 [Vezdaea acicularis]